MFHADLHVHSRFSLACSKTCDIPSLAWWAVRKGITVLGTGDFTHPAWANEIRETLLPAEPGLLRLRPDLEDRLRRSSPRSCRGDVRFILSAEISTIYRADGRTRKVHHLIYAPSLEAADRITRTLARVGNLASDGRPILGLDSRDLLDITLNGGPACYLIPAHIWTPWFAVLGSKSGFDMVADCYRDLADHIFAVETGLSSDPPMNWSCSQLDRYQLVSNSDAHSPPMLGREATSLDTELDYFAIERALRTGDGLEGTLNFFPEGGRYHLDGHRKCGIRMDPAQTADIGGICPGCGKPLTIGVLNRVAELADRKPGYRPSTVRSKNLVALPEIVSEIVGSGPKTKKVNADVNRLVTLLGPELSILCDVPEHDLAQAGGSLLALAVSRLRRGEVHKEAGYDGEYGKILLLRPGERDRADALFHLPGVAPGSVRSGEAQPRLAASQHDGDRPGGGEWGARCVEDEGSRGVRPAGSALDGLDDEQRAAVVAPSPLMIIAGPGTGKTHTLARRIGACVTQGAVPESCLAITFTRRAAQEMGSRLQALLGPRAAGLTVTTFHGLGLMILREFHALAGLNAHFAVADEPAVLAVATVLSGSPRAARSMLATAKAGPGKGEAGPVTEREALRTALTARNLVDLDGLVGLPAMLMRDWPTVAESLRRRWPLISVDEYQDIDGAQEELLGLLAGPGSGLTVIGDPDQAIYGFRGADVGFFLRFGQHYPGARTLQLSTNYRSSPAIVSGAIQAITPSTLVPGRALRPTGGAGPAGGAGPGRPADGPRRHRPAGEPRPAGPDRITFHEAADPAGEAAWIAQAIDRLLGGSSFHSLDSGRADGHGHGGIGLADIAVLYRTDAQAGPLVQALNRAGLPFQKRSHDLLGRRAAVPEIVHEIRMLSARRDPPADATDGADGNFGEGGLASAWLRAAVRTLIARPSTRSPADVLTAGEILGPLARRCGDDAPKFLTEIALGAEVDALDPRADAVSLLTMHAAKGLEFEIVFLAGCEKGLLPLWLPGKRAATAAEAAKEAEAAEERRLFFVAMTRARSRLLLTCAASRPRRGVAKTGGGTGSGGTGDGSTSTGGTGSGGTGSGASPFLAAIDPGLLDRSTSAQRRGARSRQLRLL
ncbi:MAG TPA: UvrD-helicase domain-containing protein [Streptosporangiaceae bacterium]|nr:UvrD-helicase domain-containing protein [Streptosporangiaceae bacterium]